MKQVKSRFDFLRQDLLFWTLLIWDMFNCTSVGSVHLHPEHNVTCSDPPPPSEPLSVCEVCDYLSGGRCAWADPLQLSCNQDSDKDSGLPHPPCRVVAPAQSACFFNLSLVSNGSLPVSCNNSFSSPFSFLCSALDQVSSSTSDSQRLPGFCCGPARFCYWSGPGSCPTPFAQQ